MDLSAFLDAPNADNFALVIGSKPNNSVEEGELQFGPAYGWKSFKFRKDKCSFIPTYPIPVLKVLEYFNTLGVNYIGPKISQSANGYCIATDRGMLFCMTINSEKKVTAVDLFFAQKK